MHLHKLVSFFKVSLDKKTVWNFLLIEWEFLIEGYWLTFIEYLDFLLACICLCIRLSHLVWILDIKWTKEIQKNIRREKKKKLFLMPSIIDQIDTIKSRWFRKQVGWSLPGNHQLWPLVLPLRNKESEHNQWFCCDRLIAIFTDSFCFLQTQ